MSAFHQAARELRAAADRLDAMHIEDVQPCKDMGLRDALNKLRASIPSFCLTMNAWVHDYEQRPDIAWRVWNADAKTGHDSKSLAEAIAAAIAAQAAAIAAQAAADAPAHAIEAAENVLDPVPL